MADAMTEQNLPEEPTTPTTTETTTETKPEAAPSAAVPVPVAETAPMPSAQEETAADPAPEEVVPEMTESFADALAAFERGHARKPAGGAKQLEGTVISVSIEQVFLDIGYKTEGVLPRGAFERNAEDVKPGDVVMVSVKGRNEEGYYDLTRHKVAQPRDWSALETAFAEKTAVVGTVTGVVKGGLTVDVGVRAFLPASRSGTRDAAELEKLVGTEITCRITKLDVADENVVVDRRVVLEEEVREAASGRLAALLVGDTVTGTVRSVMSYGAFVDLGGVDGLLHVSDMAWSRVNKPEDVVEVGQQVQVRILKMDPETKKISLGLKQLQPEPWETAPGRYQAGQRVRGAVSRLTDFGAFVELEPGVEGMIHVSEMAWNKKVRHPGDLLKVGDQVDAVVLAVKPEERRIALGLKQTLADPWVEAAQRFPTGAQVSGPVTRMTAFGAFVEVAEGVEGLVHISEIVADRRLNHPSDVLHVGQVVKAQVLALDKDKRQMKLSMKQLIPTSLDEYLAEHKAGDIVSGRVVDASGAQAMVELGEGVRAVCRGLKAAADAPGAEAKSEARADLSSLTSMLSAKWKGKGPTAAADPEALKAGQIRSFRIVAIEAGARRVEVEIA
jgi:small subunit ribosomal protein S1